MKRIGVDVGGTNTDAVLVADGSVEAAVKATTTSDVTDGIVTAIDGLQTRGVLADEVSAVLIGTTHFVNAVVQRRDLGKVAAVRIGAPATTALPPFVDWPTDLEKLVNGGVWILEGGHDYDGRQFVPLDTVAVRRVAREIRQAGLRHIAVSAMFSPMDASDEERVTEILLQECPDASITRSCELGGIGLLERENAALLNASLIALAERTVRSFERAMISAGFNAPLYVTQNDGTVTAAKQAIAQPIFSFASGPTNSMRGAAYLSGLDEAIVADVGGTTTDFGNLQAGFPRQANTVVHIGGVRTLFRMPDLVSIGLGGGSLVTDDGRTIGPRSVGYHLAEEALVFGGQTLTTTDVAVAAGLLDIGDRSHVAHLPPTLIRTTLETIRSMLEHNIDRAKTKSGDVILLAVGGGAVLVPEEMEGVERVLRVQHGSCANAVGAAIAQVSGEVDQVFQNVSRTEALERAQILANERATKAGADPDTLSLVEVDDIPIAYLPGNARRVRARVVGDIAIVKEGSDAGSVSYQHA